MVCHGNICRSPMAEFVLKDMVSRRGIADNFYIASAATSMEEIGNPVHHGTRNKLAQYGISTAGKYAVRMERSDYKKYDYIVVMDSWNYKNILRIVGEDPQQTGRRRTGYRNQHVCVDVGDFYCIHWIKYEFYCGNYWCNVDFTIDGKYSGGSLWNRYG